MPAINVDMMFVIDTSASMTPCLDALRKHLNELIQPSQGYVSNMRFGFVAMSAAFIFKDIYALKFLSSEGQSALNSLYAKNANDTIRHNEFFTDDTQQFTTALAGLRTGCNEDMLVALDIAADMPYGPLSNTKRVIALFSDEPFEGGIKGKGNNQRIPEIIEKLQQRHIQLFVAIPDSDAAQQLSTADRSEIELVDGGNGLAGVNFKLLLSQMGKSISGTSLQVVSEPPYNRALFGQDKWTEVLADFDV